MVIMDTNYPPDKLQEIWLNIDHLHLSYLEMEESSEKLDHRLRLEDCIREFLCIAAHSQKFFLRETADVLFRSASSKKDFSGYKAATGFNAMQLYAGNLLSQPWRKEYRQVKTYCGFYKHQIEANLVGAEIMFEAMGYKHHSNGVLVLEGPICPDTVTSVSRDCLIAYVECQIIKAIWEEISPTFKISWLEVLEFRKNHYCSPEQAIRALTYQYHQKQYQAQNSDFYNNRCHQNIVTYPPITTHNHLPPPSIQVPYNFNCCLNSYGTYSHASYVPMHYPSPPMIKPSYTNGYYCPNGYMPAHPVYGYTVPTGQLIELDGHHNGGYDVVDRPLRVARNSAGIEIKKNNEIQKQEPEKEDSFEDWDYVYRNLQSQGYSKDLGERGDVLSPTSNHKKLKPTNLDEAMHNLTVSDRPLKIGDALEKLEKIENSMKTIVEKKSSPANSYENLAEVKKVSTSKTAKTKTPLPMKEKPNNSFYEGSKTLEQVKIKKDKWECKSCTYLNENTKDICEMCSKSRISVEQQMEIGGPQCSKCTLVNSKDMKTCQACGASLKDSPTYI